jgi:hypothetical protein
MSVPSQNIKARVALVPQTVGSATTNVYGNTLDVRSFDSATFIIGARSATVSSVPSHVIIEHADDTNTASFAAITTITSGLPTQINSTAVTNQDAFAVVNVDLRGKKRYLRLGLRASSNVATMDAICILDNAGQAPVNATAAGTLYFNAVG